METVAIIVAAGKGVRAGGRIPKQYEMSQETRMITLTIQALLSSLQIEAILVVISPKDLNLYLDSIKTLDKTRILPHCYGGSERAASVRRGLQELKQYNPKNILIHDAARPFVSSILINRVINSLQKHNAVLPVLPIVDAIWEKSKKTDSDNNIKPGPNRDNFLLAQTPQGFDYLSICSAYDKSKKYELDDIAIAYEAGIKINIVKGDVTNRKITSKQDLKNFKRITNK